MIITIDWHDYRTPDTQQRLDVVVRWSDAVDQMQFIAEGAALAMGGRAVEASIPGGREWRIIVDGDVIAAAVRAQPATLDELGLSPVG